MTPEQMDRAGQYVLGLLADDALARFERDMAADPALATSVARLQARLQALDDTVVAPPPSAALWASIERSLDAAAPSVQETSNVVPLRRALPRQTGWMAIAASVVAALGVGYLVGSVGTGTAEPVMIAVLVSQDDASPGAIVEAFADDSVRLVPLDRFEIPEGQILEVWTLPDPETGPVSLGTFSDPTSIRLAGPDLAPPAAGQLYEITLEPAPGSPTGRPTGPILVKGFAKAPQ